MTGPAVEGSVKITDATPEPFVATTTFEAPLKLPASVEKRILAPVMVPPDEPAPRVTASVMVVPFVPDNGSVVFVKVAAGF